MNDIQRFDNPDDNGWMSENSSGDWVKYEDHITKLNSELSKLKEQMVVVWQSGYNRGHNDTVEGCYDLSLETEPDGAIECINQLEGTSMIHNSKYAMYNPEKKRIETWEDTINRVANILTKNS